MRPLTAQQEYNLKKVAEQLAMFQMINRPNYSTQKQKLPTNETFPSTINEYTIVSGNHQDVNNQLPRMVPTRYPSTTDSGISSPSPSIWDTIEYETYCEVVSTQQIPYRDYICHRCNQKGHMIRNCPTKSSTVALTPYQGVRRSIGWFRCVCGRNWKNEQSFANTPSVCKNCRLAVYPHKQTPIENEKMKAAPDTTAKILSSLDETDFQKLLDRSIDFQKQLVDGQSGFASFDRSRDRLCSDSSLADSLYQRERRELIDRDTAGEQHKSCFIKQRSEYSTSAKLPPATSSKKRPPVGVNMTDIDYIDDGMEINMDVEMQDLSRPNNVLIDFIKGNYEQKVEELSDQMNNNDVDDIEAKKMIDGIREKKDGGLLGYTGHPPHHKGLPAGLKLKVEGTDERPSLTVSGGGMLSERERTSNDYIMTSSPMNAFRNNLVEREVFTSQINRSGVVPPQLHQQNMDYNSPYSIHNNNFDGRNGFENNKQQKRKKKKSSEQGKIIEHVHLDGYMGDKPIEAILVEIEGPTATAAKKKNSQGNIKEEKRRKKDQKEKNGGISPKQSVQQQTEKTADNNKENVNEDSVKSDKRDKEKIDTAVPSNTSDNIGNQGGKVGGASSRASLEEEYVSADEGGRETPAPSRYASVAEAPAVTSEVLLDGENFLADDDDVIGQINKVDAKDEAFIPVTKMKKTSPKEQKENGVVSVPRRTGSVSSQPITTPERRLSVGGIPRHPSAHVPCIADYIDEAKHTKLNPHGKASGKSKKNVNNKDKEHIENNVPLVVNTNNEMAILSSECRPSPQFSYADAAKRTSGESSPSALGSPKPCENQTNGMVASTSSPLPLCSSEVEKRESPSAKSIPKVEEKKKKKKEASSVVSPPPPPTTLPPVSSNLGISFFYDESAVKEESADNSIILPPSQPSDSDQLQSESGALILQLGDKKITFQDTVIQQARSIDANTSKLWDSLAIQWDRFLNKGSAPSCYRAYHGFE